MQDLLPTNLPPDQPPMSTNFGSTTSEVVAYRPSRPRSLSFWAGLSTIPVALALLVSYGLSRSLDAEVMPSAPLTAPVATPALPPGASAEQSSVTPMPTGAACAPAAATLAEPQEGAGEPPRPLPVRRGLSKPVPEPLPGAPVTAQPPSPPRY